MSTAKRKILRGGSVLLALLLTGWAGGELREARVQEPELRYLASKPGFVLSGSSLRDIYALSNRTASVSTFKDPDACYFSRISPPELAPGWVCEKAYAGLAIQAFGVVEPSTDIGADIRRAEQRARTAIAREYVSEIVSEVREFYEATGVRAGAVNAIADAVSETLTKQILLGVGRKGSIRDREGRMYVLVGIDLQKHESNIKSSVDGVNDTVKKVRTTRSDDDAEYQLWRAQEAFDRLRNTSGVRNVAISPDGRRALSGSWDKTFLLRERYSALTPKQLQAALQKKASQRLQQRLEAFAGLPVPDPVLPPVPRSRKDPFETKAMFDDRIERIQTERARQITAIKKQYRSAVKARNAKLRKFEKILEKERLSYYSDAFKEVYGHPLLEALTDAQGEPKYDPEKQRLYLSFRHQNAKEAQEWSFQVPPGKPARELYQALKEGSTTASAHYQLKGNSLVLDTVYAHHGGTRYPGAPAGAEDYAPQNMVARGIGEENVLRGLRQQNPQIKDVQLEEVLVQERKDFDDDIPQLLRKARAATVDPHKWLFVIGVEKYRETNNIAYARRSAELFAQVASKSLGIHKKRRKILLDDQASSGAIEDNLKKLLQQVEPEDSIYFYYSGHGIPVPDKENEPYILPADKIPQFIGDDAFYRVANIYQALQSSKARQVFLFMDSCFTGQADNRPVMEDVASVTRPKDLHIAKNGKLAVLTAGTKNQFSNAYRAKGHRLFSYFLMRQLLSGHKTFGDLALQVTAQVAHQTKGFGSKTQNPVSQGNPHLQL